MFFAESLASDAGILSNYTYQKDPDFLFMKLRLTP